MWSNREATANTSIFKHFPVNYRFGNSQLYGYKMTVFSVILRLVEDHLQNHYCDDEEIKLKKKINFIAIFQIGL